jgi:hypothetical protein
MVSERIQRRIDRLLDQAEQAADQELGECRDDESLALGEEQFGPLLSAQTRGTGACTRPSAAPFSSGIALSVPAVGVPA